MICQEGIRPSLTFVSVFSTDVLFAGGKFAFEDQLLRRKVKSDAAVPSAIRCHLFCLDLRSKAFPRLPLSKNRDWEYFIQGTNGRSLHEKSPPEMARIGWWFRLTYISEGITEEIFVAMSQYGVSCVLIMQPLHAIKCGAVSSGDVLISMRLVYG